MSSTVGDASDDYKSSCSSEDESEPSGREYSSQDESSDEDVRETLSCLHRGGHSNLEVKFQVFSR